MGYLSDALRFEKYWISDLWDGIRKQPTRLLTGIDPISTAGWNAVLGRDDKALVNQLGGPPSRTYENAEAAGVPTDAGRTMHGIAQTVAGMYGAAGVGGAFGLGGGGAGSAQGAQPGLWDQAFSGTTGFSGAPYGSAPAAGIGGIAGPVGGGTGAGASAGLGGMDYAKLGMQAMGQMQPQQQPQQPPPQAPVRNMAQPTPVPTYGQRISSGLGRVSEAMFPVDPNSGMTADQIRQLRTNAMMQMGLGMMGASGRGAGFGESLAKGYGLAQGNLQGTMQQAYENAVTKRAETRAEDREKRLDEQQQWLKDHQQQRDLITDSRSLAEFDYRSQQDKVAQERWDIEQKATADWRKKQLDQRGLAAPPAGYRWNPETGGLQYIPGGPADPKVGERTVKPTEGQLTSANYLGRMEKAETLLGDYAPSTTDYAAAMRLYGTDNAGFASTMLANNLISEDGKNYYQAAADWVRAKLRKESGAAIPPSEMAQEIRTYFPMPGDPESTIKQKAAAREQAAEGMRGMAGVAAPAGAESAGPPQLPSARKSVGGKNYVQINGQWYEDDGT